MSAGRRKEREDGTEFEEVANGGADAEKAHRQRGDAESESGCGEEDEAEMWGRSLRVRGVEIHLIHAGEESGKQREKHGRIA